LKFHFLGTSAGGPTIERNVAALALTFEQKGMWYLFDAGDGTQQQILKTSLSLPRLDKIFITHMHGDHCYGLPGLLTSRGLMSGGEKGVTIYGPVGIKEFVITILRLSHTNLDYEIDFVEFSESQTIFEDNCEIIRCVKLSHDAPSFGFVIEEKERAGVFDVEKARAAGVPNGPLYGKLSRGETIVLDNGRVFDGADFVGPSRKGRKVIIGGDNDSPELLEDCLQSADVFIHESTHTKEVKENLAWDARHSTAESVAEVATRAGVANLILTHFSPRYSLKVPDGHASSLSRVRDEAQSKYSGNLKMAQDFDCFSLDRNGVLKLEFRKKL